MEPKADAQSGIIRLAKEHYENETIQIEDNAPVSETSNGCWVQAWVWLGRRNWQRLDARRWMDSVAGDVEDGRELAERAVAELDLPDEWLSDPSHWIHEEAWLNVMNYSK
jgi:hypothetical protein